MGDRSLAGRLRGPARRGGADRPGENGRLEQEQVLACMGPPAQKMAEGATEVWSYNSGNNRVTAVGTGYSQTSGSFSGQRTETVNSGRTAGNHGQLKLGDGEPPVLQHQRHDERRCCQPHQLHAPDRRIAHGWEAMRLCVRELHQLAPCASAMSTINCPHCQATNRKPVCGRCGAQLSDPPE